MGVSVGVDESINCFMAEGGCVVSVEIGADLFRTQIPLEQRHHETLSLSSTLAMRTRIRPVLVVEISRPVIGVAVRGGPQAAPLLSADRGGRTPECLGDLHRACALTYGLMNVEPFLIAKVLMVSHRAISPLCE